jgi:UDP-N-acetylmuramate-alanine ligase
MGIAGLHNIENAVAAIEAALHVEVSADAIHEALGSFKGVKRRFEYIVKNDSISILMIMRTPRRIKGGHNISKKVVSN